MFRTILAVGALTLAGLVLLRFTFGILGGLMGLFLFVLALAVKIALVGLAIYFIIRVLSPETARRLRMRFSGHDW